MGNYTTQKNCQAIFSARNALNCQLAHICFGSGGIPEEIQTLVWRTQRSSKDAIHLGPHFECDTYKLSRALLTQLVFGDSY
jgi:hypothetical protein